MKPDKLNFADIEQVNSVYYELFSSNFLNDKVIDFLTSNIRSKKNSNVEPRIWIRRECGEFSQRVFPVVFSDMLINGFCYTDRIIKKIDSECIEKPINEAYNLWVLHKNMYHYTEDNEKYITMLINNEFRMGVKVRFFRILINELLKIAKHLFSGINLQDIDISSTDFSKAYLIRCNFYKTNLTRADFSDAVINESSLKSAKCMKSNFRKISMYGVNAYRTNFNNADLMSEKLEKTSRVSCQEREVQQAESAEIRETVSGMEGTAATGTTEGASNGAATGSTQMSGGTAAGSGATAAEVASSGFEATV